MDGTKAEIRPLSGLRGIAALSVAIGHFETVNLVPALRNAYGWTDPSVDLFFCLSGFTMCLAYRASEAGRLPLRNYLVARIARIYPLYLLTLVFCSFMEGRLTRFQHTATVWDFVRQLTMTNAWSVLGSGIHWNPPAWSVSVEFFCYLFVFPALFPLSRWMSGYGWRVRLILSTVLVATSFYVYARYTNPLIFACGRESKCGIREIAYAVNLLRGVLGFAAGWVVYASFVSRDRLWAWATRYADRVVLAILAFMALGALGSPVSKLMLVGFPLMILAVSSGRSLASRVLSWGPVHYLGSISYSIYLLHIPWSYFGSDILGLFPNNPSTSLPSSTIQVGGMLAVSALSYHTIELPLRRLVRAAWQTPNATSRGQVSRGMACARWATLAAALILVGGATWRVQMFPARVAVGEEITRFPVFERLPSAGWSTREDWGIWSVGRDSTLDFRVRKPAPAQLDLFIKGSFYLNDRHPTLIARVTANGVEIGKFKPTAANPAIEATLPLPATLLLQTGKPVRIEILIDNPASPKSLGLSDDNRVLGFGVQSLKLVAE